LFSVKDVSDYKQIEQTAYQNDKLAMLGRISASIAHEIRNPLTAIRGFIQLLRPHLLQLGKDEYARIILTEIDRANDIIYEFLNSSKPSAPQKTIMSVDSLLKEVVLLTESEGLMKGCEITLDKADSPMNVSIDVKQIKQVILNMVKNAMDAIDGVGEEHTGLIRISTETENKYVQISITDNGQGMDHNTLVRLFDPFFTTKESGTGLGLSVSYRIIKNHGGTISVDSKKGEGTRFMIMLPLV
jgi:signal transduction histidine kinase